MRRLLGGVLVAALTAVGAPAVAAGWTDAVNVSGTTLSAATVRTPADFTCTGLGLTGLTFSWTPVPGAVSYTLRWSGGQATIAESSYTTGALLAAGNATVEANFGSWGVSAKSAQKGYLLLLGGVAICG